MKSSKVSIKTRSTPASLSFKGQATKQTTVKWSIVLYHRFYQILVAPNPSKANIHAFQWIHFEKIENNVSIERLQPTTSATLSLAHLSGRLKIASVSHRE